MGVCKKGLHEKISAGVCKSCKALWGKQYKIDYPEKRMAIQRKYNSIHRERRLAETKERYKKNIESIKIYRQAFQKENLHKYRARNAKRYASKIQRTPRWLSNNDFKIIENIYLEAKELKWLSDGGLDVDHIIPLVGKFMSGLHVPWNLRIIPKKSNQSRPRNIKPFIGTAPCEDNT